MIEINVFIDSLKVTWIRKMLKEDKTRWMALLKEDVPDLDLQKYSGSRFLFSKPSAVNPFWRDVFFVIYQIFRKVHPSNCIRISLRNQSYSTTKSKSRERLSQDKFGEG